MEIDRTITNVWTIRVSEDEVISRLIDETVQDHARAKANGRDGAMVASDNDRAIIHRYYCAVLAELSSVLVRRIRRFGGTMTNVTDETTKMITTTYTLAMTNNHESDLIHALGAHCLEFLVCRLQEKWYGHGSNFGSEQEKDQVRDILQHRRFPIERPVRPL